MILVTEKCKHNEKKHDQNIGTAEHTRHLNGHKVQKNVKLILLYYKTNDEHK